MDVLNFIANNFKVLIIIVIIIILLIVCKNIMRKLTRSIKKIFRPISGAKRALNDVSTLAKIISDASDIPEPKSVGGATNLYLKKITKDFPSFHNPDAEAAIRSFIIEYLDIKYGKSSRFKKSKVNKNILFNINKIKGQSVSNLTFNGIAIYNYEKSIDYATIVYRCSFGYDLNGQRREVRYDIDYTLQLFDNGIAQKAMTCSNCGGVLSINDNVECPYCGSKIIMDTIMNWYITEMAQNL